MALSPKYVEQWTKSFMALMMALVLRALAGIKIDILGTSITPFALLQQWADDISATAIDAYNGAVLSQAQSASAQVISNQALAVAQGNASGGVSHSETFAGSGALDSGVWTVSVSRIQRVNDELGMTTQTGDGGYQDWFVYKNQFNTDDQSVAVVLGRYGDTAVDSGIFTRCNSDATRFVYCNFFPNQLFLGHATRSGGSWTFNDWSNPSLTIQSGDSILLESKGSTHRVYVNGALITTYIDSASDGPIGTDHRYAGGKIEQQRLFFINKRSHHLRGFSISDV